MKRFGKLLALTAIVSVLGVSIPFQSFAASKTISSVTIYAGLEELESERIFRRRRPLNLRKIPRATMYIPTTADTRSAV